MHHLMLLLAAFAVIPLPTSYDQSRSIQVDGRERSYLLHVPPGYQPDEPIPVILVLHGAGTNAAIMMAMCGMNEKADSAGFIAVYPNGTGVGIFQTFNAGGHREPEAAEQPDDVRYIAELLDDLALAFNIDFRRVYATGMSNGGMMCYRLASELSDRIAAIAPVSGTMAIREPSPGRPVSIMHFHGTDDRIVPPDGPSEEAPTAIEFLSVEDTLRQWVRLNGCRNIPTVQELDNSFEDGTTVTQLSYSGCRAESEIVYVKIDGGGHTWPGRQPLVSFLGRSTKNVSANDMMWSFFERHRLPEGAE